jgi:tryptophan 2,3-dioxygenase
MDRLNQARHEPSDLFTARLLGGENRLDVTVLARNERGVIAEHYRDLQSLELLEQARAATDVPPASSASYVRTILQACEIALYNLADLLRRADANKLGWARGFHDVLVSLSSVSASFTAADARSSASPVPLGDSPAFAEYLGALRDFDRRTLASELDLVDVLAHDGLSSDALRLLHFARIGAHEATIWERSLLATAVPESDAAYADMIASTVLRTAVHEHRLAGDTYFLQFRGLHQIPELLAREMNDRLEVAVLALRRGDCDGGAEQLMWVNALSQPVRACLRPLIDNLATSDYHEIRENLGLTSGSHSVGIRYHLFTDLYEQVCEALPRPVPGLLRAQLAAFRAFITGWRDAHLHLPRNNLGGDATKSLTGSPDAIAVVRRMGEHARAHDPARELLTHPADGHPIVAPYLEARGSLDSAVLSATGRVTQAKFVEVQERSGFFADRCPFTKPARREV